jgi:hypothetical protein
VKESPAYDAAIAFLAKRLADYGQLTYHEIKPDWKIPELDESTWSITLITPPDKVLSPLTQSLGSAWHVAPDAAHIDHRHGQIGHEGISSIFVDIEQLDWGREYGILPAYSLGDEVVVIDSPDPFAAYKGRTATIRGHAFDRQGTRRWSYALEIVDVEHLYCADEDDIQPKG